MASETGAPANAKRLGPYAFIMGFGLVSMLMDVVYQAALSVQGPLLASFGASAFLVGLISGLGEATSLAGRLFSGPLADRSGKYWLFAIVGYAATGLAVPAMGFAGSLGAVAFLVVFERFGKSVRTPSRDAMLSHAASVVGRGKGFALHEVMDQIGAMGGPLLVAALLFATGNDYRVALGLMIVPGCLALVSLVVLRNKVPDSRVYEPAAGTAGEGPASPEPSGQQADPDGKPRVEAQKRRAVAARLPKVFWAYAAACGIMLAGVATFGVLSFHMVTSGLMDESFVPLLYAAAMGVDAVFAGLTGVLYDKLGTRVLLVLPFVCAAIPLFAYGNAVGIVLVGVVLWGASLGIQESTMRAAVGDMVDPDLRAGAYGFFSMAVGVGSLTGGIVAGALYDVGVAVLVAYVLVVEAAALVLLLRALRTRA